MKIDEEIYKQHKIRGYTTHAMASLMLANRAFQVNCNDTISKPEVDIALDLYFKICSILINV